MKTKNSFLASVFRALECRNSSEKLGLKKCQLLGILESFPLSDIETIQKTVFTYSYNFHARKWERRLRHGVKKRLILDSGVSPSAINRALSGWTDCDYQTALQRLRDNKRNTTPTKPGELYGKRFGLFVCQIGSLAQNSRGRATVVLRCSKCKAEKRVEVAMLNRGWGLKCCRACGSGFVGSGHVVNSACTQRTESERLTRGEALAASGLSWFSRCVAGGGAEFLDFYLDVRMNADALKIWAMFHGWEL